MERDDLLRDVLGVANFDDEDAVMMLIENYMDELFLDEEPEEPLKLGIDINRWREADGRNFSDHFRMTKETFQKLIVAVGNELERTNVVHDRRRRPLDISLMMSIWILATNDTFRSTAIKFGVTKGVVFYHYVQTICALTSLAGRYIAWPDRNERENIANAFEEMSGYMGCVGAIDGVNVYCTAPLEQPQRYVNRHHTFSILVQAVCDNRKLYRDVYVGEPGSVGDLLMFERSPLCGNLFRNPDMLSEGQHIIGDQAYPLCEKIQIPYPEINADERQRYHNYCLSSCRSIVERSFALLKEKFQRLRRFRSYSLNVTMRHIMSCLVLHNFIILEGEALRAHDEDDNPLPNDLPPLDPNALAESRLRGAVKREYICLMLSNNRNHNHQD